VTVTNGGQGQYIGAIEIIYFGAGGAEIGSGRPAWTRNWWPARRW